MQHWNILSLRQLRQLETDNCLQQPELLAPLSTMAALTAIHLSYDAAVAVAVAAVWQQLSALHSLWLKAGDEDLDPTQSQLLLQGLAAATSLTILRLEAHNVHESVQLCAHLTALTRLQDLDLDCKHLATLADVLHLTVLTSLTRLHVCNAAGVDDTAASALALRLKRLQELRLSYCGLRSAAALPSIATLTGLTSLSLYVDPHTADLDLGRDELRLLAPLTQLKELDCDALFGEPAIGEEWIDVLQQWQRQQA